MSVFYWVGLPMLELGSYLTSLTQMGYLKSDLQKVEISDPHCFYCATMKIFKPHSV